MALVADDSCRESSIEKTQGHLSGPYLLMLLLSSELCAALHSGCELAAVAFAT